MGSARWRLGGVVALVVVAVSVFAFGVASGTATTTSAKAVCTKAAGVATWSPDGNRIAYVGQLHAICIASADGRHARALPYTVCEGRCRAKLPDPPIQLAWVRPKLLLYLDDFQIFKVQVGQRPQLLGTVQGKIDMFAVDARADRAALGSSACPNCRGPVTVLSVPAGRIVSQIGGPTADNDFPSLSPDGKRLVFVGTTGASTAWADGSNLQPLKQCGGTPLWSPRGGKIACSGLPAQSPRRCCSLLLVPPQGGAATTLVPRGATPDVLGWSANGRRIVFLTGHCSCRLAVVDVRTAKTRSLPSGSCATTRACAPVSAAWSPDSRQLLVTDPSQSQPDCVLLWRVPASGATPTQLHSCP